MRSSTKVRLGAQIGAICLIQVCVMSPCPAARYTQIVFEGTEVIPAGTRGGRLPYPAIVNTPNNPVPDRDLSFPFRRIFTIDREAHCMFIESQTRLWREDLAELEPVSKRLSYHDAELSVGFWNGELFQAGSSVNDVWGSAILHYFCGAELTQQNLASLCAQFPVDSGGEKASARILVGRANDTVIQIISSPRNANARTIAVFVRGQAAATSVFFPVVGSTGASPIIAFRGVLIGGSLGYTIRSGRLEVNQVQEIPQDYHQLKEAAGRFEAPAIRNPNQNASAANTGFSQGMALVSLAIMFVMLFVAKRHKKGTSR